MIYWHQPLCVTQSLLSSKQHAFMDCSVIGHSLMQILQCAVQQKRFRPVQKFRDRKSNFLTFPGLYISHLLKIVYYISFIALLMPSYFTEPPCATAFSLLSQNKAVIRLKASLIAPFFPYRTKNEVSGMLKQKNSRCNTEANMFDILIIRDTVGSL